MADPNEHGNKDVSYRQLSRPAFCILALVLILASSWGQPSGNNTGREAACEREELPEEYRQFLNTSFIGPAQKIGVGAVNFTYHRFGPLDQEKSTGRTLVLVAGVRCTLSTWTPDLLKTLAAKREVVIFDNAGVGLSPDAGWPDNVSIEHYAETTLDLISALDIKQPDVLGWSMGGIITLWIATHSAEEVHRFVIVNSFAGAPAPLGAVAALQQPMASLPTSTRKTSLDATGIFPDTRAGNAALCRYIKLAQEMPKDGVSDQEVALQWKAISEFMKGGGVLAQLSAVQNPTLLVVGTHAGEGPASYNMLAELPNCALLAFSDAAHGAIFQHSLSAASAISNFLDSKFE